ncbi:4Fe-4S dicluster domain-containing protein [Desulfosoma caldarium]|uniref:4Fe-4S dicluster protein n=1 Tax=Desulfosoma caldarium TaxID=610254 RepID=A0A3N1VG61_9BACT|nr:4Fe-4S dicluster domain-containing protein [Desulfosoma caldarium]ROR01826.1 4Fe-4S dicluster protein [Desulfosoma caldarium]
MNNASFVSHAELADLLRRLSEQAEVWVPTRQAMTPHRPMFRPFQAGMDLDFQPMPVTSAKGVLFPQGEELLKFRKEKSLSEATVTTLLWEDPAVFRPTIVFGCRPCDARGFLVFDRAFLQGSFVDPFYKARRDKNLVVSMVCPEPDAACFCGAVGSHPADTEGSDVQMIPVKEGYVLHGLTEKGQEFLKNVENTPSQAQQEEARQVWTSAQGSVDSGASLTDDAQHFFKRFADTAFWRFHTERCLSCGVCTYLCPTCYCFTLTDETNGVHGERLRSWDACMFHHFTQEASGHNPRPTKAERFRNRVGHKFSYFPEKHGRFACCGCGRCLRHCPVGMDIRAIVRALGESEEVHD